jgi:DNA-binding SARP family transcriptional activator/Tfp pilus assembly protein PilF
MEFRLLGPLEVCDDGGLIAVSAGGQRALLAALLLKAGRVVRVDDLIDVLWDAEPPRFARGSLQNHVRRLRQSLGDAGHDLIRTHEQGYLIGVEPGGLDVTSFESLLTGATVAARSGSWATAAADARAALALWRGEPLADVGSAVLAEREVPRLAEMRLQAAEVSLDAELNLGHYADVISELRQLVAVHPLRERMYALLMLALYRDGRQGEALAAYQQARDALIDELGTEPGSALRELHQQILRADLALMVTSPARDAVARPGPDIPRELPAAVPHFAGRVQELAALNSLLDQAGGQAPAAMVISAIDGTAGVGKTALAVHWAHRVAGRFPDGQLYVNLCGYDPGKPMAAADALAGFLRSLGVPGADIPAETQERAARYRSLLAGRRVLVLLDNAREADQVRPLLPGSTGCLAVVTSRDTLGGLVVREGAKRLDLDLLPLAEAVSLLTVLIGERALADRAATRMLATRCARLPLALRVAAELAAIRRDVPLAALTAELADQQRRLDLLDSAGDHLTAVRAVFSWSRRHLDPEAARIFGLLGCHPGADFDRYAAAALAGATAAQAGQTLGVLARAHLIQPAGPGRFGLHDLLRAYAAELAGKQNGEQGERAAIGRLLDHYLFTAATAMDILYPGERERRPRVPRPTTPVPPVDTAAVAKDWLDGHRPALIAVAAHAAGGGWPSHAIKLSETLYRYLEVGSYYTEITTICRHARRAARGLGDRNAEATALNSMTLVDLRQGRYERAAGRLGQVLAAYRQTGNLVGEARALGNLGIAEYLRGRYKQATGRHQRALALYRRIGDQTGESRALNNLGLVELRRGRYGPAAGHLQQALDLYRQIGNLTGQVGALANLGLVHLRQERYGEATGYLRQALDVSERASDPSGRAYALTISASIDLRQGRHERAGRQYRQALELCQRIGDLAGEADAHNGLGDLFVAIGQPGDARDQHTAALELTRQIGDRYEQARALTGLGAGYASLGDHDQARQHWQRALAIYTELGTPEAGRIAALLDG